MYAANYNLGDNITFKESGITQKTYKPHAGIYTIFTAMRAICLYNCANKIYLTKIFDTLINSFISNKVGIADNFLSPRLALHLKQNLTTLLAEKLLLPAGTGNNILVAHDTAFRSDRIYWLDRSHNNLHENAFFDLVDNFVLYLNSTCYTGIASYEFHYALYEQGSFYKKHLDQFKNNTSRKYSMIIYLNSDWQQEDGGELCIYQNNLPQTISPQNGRSVFFKSADLEHEVLRANKPRMSITGWLKT